MQNFDEQKVESLSYIVFYFIFYLVFDLDLSNKETMREVYNLVENYSLRDCLHFVFECMGSYEPGFFFVFSITIAPSDHLMKYGKTMCFSGCFRHLRDRSRVQNL